jgi:predicted phosphodiesterase
MTMHYRVAVLADIHGNLPALEAVLDDIRRYRPDGVIVAGDYTSCPQSNETIALMRPMGGWMIRGNSDERVLTYGSSETPPEWQTRLQYTLLRWDCRHMSGESVAFLRSLPEQRSVHIAGTDAIRVVHGSPRNQSESIYPDHDPDVLGPMLAQIAEPVMICGHTHEPWDRK